MFILLWAVSGHHYLTLQKERCKQMLAAHSAAIVRLAEGCSSAGGKKRDVGMLRSEAWEWGQTEVQTVSEDKDEADFEVTREPVLCLWRALVTERGAGTMGPSPGSAHWPLCGLQYYHIERKVVF